MTRKALSKLAVGVIVFMLVAACGSPATTAAPISSTDTPVPPAATLEPPTATLSPPTATTAPPAAPTQAPSPTPLPYPQARGLSAMAYDSESERVILFGGELERAYGEVVSDTWSYDGTTQQWTQMNPVISPQSATGHDMVYDTESDRVIMFAGLDTSTGFSKSFAFESTTWAYDFNTDTWTERASGPPARHGLRLAYDSESDKVILFAGKESDGPSLNDTWAYDYNTDSWTNMNPSVSPPIRNYHNMVYDAESDRVIVWGGGPSGNHNDSVWAYDFNTNTWMEKETFHGPPFGASNHSFHGMAYDFESDQIILFGGGYWEGDTTSDVTRAYDYNTNAWTRVTTNGNPGELTTHAMTYDSTLDLIILFGGRIGSSSIYSAETWTYDHNSRTWTNVTLGQE